MVPVGKESFMVAGLDFWPQLQPDVSEPRLEAALGKRGFLQPPGGDDSPTIPTVRFPIWHSCPECHRIDVHWKLADPGSNRCRTCAIDLIPSRFVVACGRGHIADFPYMSWVHQGQEKSDACKLTITTSGVSAALRDVVISCTACDIKRSLDGAFDAHEVNQATRCWSNRPWLPNNMEAHDCSEAVRTLQRGASNVWFGEYRSALSIPPWSQAAFVAINPYWVVLRGIDDRVQLARAIEGAFGDNSPDVPLEKLVSAALARKAEETEPKPTDDASFRLEEYDALITGRPPTGDADEFVAVETECPTLIGDQISRVVLAHRLREVRVLTGFTRLNAAGADGGTGEEATASASLSINDKDWLPAIEVRGEGIFLEFNKKTLGKWEQQSEVKARAAKLRDRYLNAIIQNRMPPGKAVTPRLILIHTFAHALIDELSLDAGYPAASLRERLFAAEEMCGVLIYTATSDSAGSLGGIIAQGQTARIGKLVREAIQRYEWCSADPVCAESEAQGVDGMNLAACHACALLPETSCEERNLFLDRAMLVGTAESPEIGFFASLLVN
jgi:hypothetical protein